MTDLRCTHCGIPHAEHPDASKDGGTGRILPWDGDTCPACSQQRRERQRAAARRYVSTLLDPNDDYVAVATVQPTQQTLEEVFG